MASDMTDNSMSDSECEQEKGAGQHNVDQDDVSTMTNDSQIVSRIDWFKQYDTKYIFIVVTVFYHNRLLQVLVSSGLVLVIWYNSCYSLLL